MNLDDEELRATRVSKKGVKKKANELIDLLKDYEEKDEDFFNDICASIVACKKWEE